MTVRQHAWIAFSLVTAWIILNGLFELSVPLPLMLYRSIYFIGPFVLLSNLYLYWTTGTLGHTPWGRLLWISAGLLALAVNSRIMHWPYAIEAFIFAMLFTMVIYAFHFIKKSQKHLGDILRLLVVVITATFASLSFIKWIAPEQYLWAVAGIIGITTLEYLLSTSPSRKKKQAT
jgi:hypothetical protein